MSCCSWSPPCSEVRGPSSSPQNAAHGHHGHCCHHHRHGHPEHNVGQHHRPPNCGARPHLGQLCVGGCGDVTLRGGHARGAVWRTAPVQALLGGPPAPQQRHRGGREDHHHLPGKWHPPCPRLGAARFRLISVSLKPTHPELRGEDPEGQDAETERFLSTSSTGRRVSFNEAALFEQSRKAQDKGRRYTLTEGDFHHLKNARLTHLHLPPLKIVTIHECDSGEASATTMPHPTATPKASLAIFQPPGKALTGHSVGPSSALPGDPYHPATGPADFEISPSTSSDSGEGTSLDAGARSAKPPGLGAAAGPGEADPGPGVGPVLQFFTRLRRHASLDGASPYFKVKKWKLEPNQRASSLDTRGSPKRHHFQRQRAASESMEQEGDTPHVDFIQYIASAGATMAFPPPHPFVASPTSPPPTLGRLEAEEAAGPAGGASPESPPENGGGSGWGPQQQQESDGERDAGSEQVQTIYHDIWSLRASLELHAATASDQSSNDRDSVRSGDSSGSGGTAPAFPPLSPPPTPRSMDGEAGGSRKLLQMDSGYASIEGRSAGEDGPPSLPEKRSSFTSAGHMATMGVSFEGAPAEAPTRPCGPHVWPRHAPRRDYSVDEKTDALFHEFLRHDPHFDNAPPITARHRTRAHPHPHVRKQWQQRGRQHSDPGAHAAPPAPPGADPCPMRAPLRRGDSVDCTSDTHTGDDLAVPAAPAIPAIEEEPCSGCPGSSLCIGPPGQMLDKLAAGLEDRLFPPHLVQSVSVVPMLAAAAAPTSPDHSPA
ncbi:PREDICTED: voltage-dependent calcium channel beta subunit-associated regulatory protein isoform X5 [Hipposideros armiger]|uniref:Voltage-dependent calcium channel beta subunit-associated regulatory protein isoform X5 n=1 Tax=Hipposideros armiger TaxID=186990 RepID=A0A8B7SJP5_HIPAR|nr:PREDICTED: voltage-dependent calcium channel beta subunit-associated regulatory protein isoform X5 [Hipposideros armiger]